MHTCPFALHMPPYTRISASMLFLLCDLSENRLGDLRPDCYGIVDAVIIIILIFYPSEFEAPRISYVSRVRGRLTFAGWFCHSVSSVSYGILVHNHNGPSGTLGSSPGSGVLCLQVIPTIAFTMLEGV